MKNYVIILFVFISVNVFAQIDKETVFNDTKNFALQSSNTILNHPVTQENNEVEQASVYLQEWMKTMQNDFFSISEKQILLTNTDKSLTNVYHACVVKIFIEYKEFDLKKEQFCALVTNLFVDYCDNPKNNAIKTLLVYKILNERKSKIVSN